MKPTITEVTMKGFLVLLLVISGIAQSAYIEELAPYANRPVFGYTYRAECQRQVKDANVCKEHDILS
jgi:hypothetical protein